MGNAWWVVAGDRRIWCWKLDFAFGSSILIAQHFPTNILVVRRGLEGCNIKKCDRGLQTGISVRVWFIQCALLQYPLNLTICDSRHATCTWTWPPVVRVRAGFWHPPVRVSWLCSLSTSKSCAPRSLFLLHLLCSFTPWIRRHNRLNEGTRTVLASRDL